jgi:ABC-type transporter Mla subunit MlaD
VYTNVKLLLEIKKLTLETERLRRELADRDSRIHRPTDEELRKFLASSASYLDSLSANSRQLFSLSDTLSETISAAGSEPLVSGVRHIAADLETLMEAFGPLRRDIQHLISVGDRLARICEESANGEYMLELVEQLKHLALVVDWRAPRA